MSGEPLVISSVKTSVQLEFVTTKLFAFINFLWLQKRNNLASMSAKLYIKLKRSSWCMLVEVSGLSDHLVAPFLSNFEVNLKSEFLSVFRHTAKF